MLLAFGHFHESSSAQHGEPDSWVCETKSLADLQEAVICLSCGNVNARFTPISFGSCDSF
jgi:hypothetical protein